MQKTIRAQMGARGWTVTALAEAVGLKRPYLSQRLNGHAEFKTGELASIGAVLGVPAWELMRRAERTAALAAPDDSSDGYAIQDAASGSVILQARRVDFDGGDEA